MIEFWKKFRTSAIIINACLFVLGLVMVIWPEISALTVCYILGALFVVMGACLLGRYFSIGLAGIFFRFDLIAGLVNVLVGLLLLIHPHGAIAVLPVAASIYILIGGVVDIQTGVELRRYGVASWWGSLVMGVVSMLFAFFLIFDPFTGANALMIFAGISLIVSALENFYTIYLISKGIKSHWDDHIIDAKWTPIE